MSNLIRRVTILTILWVYTTFKVAQIYPAHLITCVVSVYFFLMVMIGWMFLYHAKPELIDKLWFRVFAWLGSFAMGMWATFVLFSLMYDFVLLIYYVVSHLTHLIPYHADKVYQFTMQVDAIILALSLLVSLLGFLQVLVGPKVKKVVINIPHLPEALNNLKIAQISDLHIGPTIRKNYVERVVRLTNATQPDFIVMTGDLADAKAESITNELAPLGLLRSRFGTFYVTGNHEYYWDAQGLINAVTQLGFIVLINDNRVLDFDGAKVLVAGITDNIGGKFLPGHHPDLRKALACEEVTQFKILLAHRPDPYIEAEKLGFDLQFAGHTHAGQFFPFNILIPLAHKYYRRLNQYGRLWLHVNPGTGYWGPANRFGVPSEITLLMLKGV
jgi:predicted MPP superfamily phosphohydrolase